MMKPVLIALMFLVLPLQAWAIAIYEYTGNNFSYRDGIYTVNESVTGSLTLSSVLESNFSSEIINPISFSFSDGPKDLTNMNAYDSSFKFSTNATGGITDWSIVIYSLFIGEFVRIGSSGLGDVAATWGCANVECSEMGSLVGHAGADDIGSWAVSTTTVPEPSALVLMAIGFIGIGAARKLKKH